MSWLRISGGIAIVAVAYYFGPVWVFWFLALVVVRAISSVVSW